MPERKTPFVPVSLTYPARDALRHRTHQSVAVVDGRIAMSDVLLVLDELAAEHPERFEFLLKRYWQNKTE